MFGNDWLITPLNINFPATQTPVEPDNNPIPDYPTESNNARRKASSVNDHIRH